MEQSTNKFIRAEYKLYDVTDSKAELLEETKPNRPFEFISGMGIAIDEFERQLSDIKEGESFDFVLEPEQAYGEHVAARVFDVDKATFFRNGKFDSEFIYEGAIVPLQNGEESFYGQIVAIGDKTVRVDLNHPYAGRRLNFKGRIVSTHEATAEEMAAFVSMLSGEGCCGGGCDSCSGGHCGGQHEGHCGGHESGHCGHHDSGHEQHCKHHGCGHHGE